MGTISERADRFVRNVYAQRRNGRMIDVSAPPAKKVDWKKIKQQRDLIKQARKGY